MSNTMPRSEFLRDPAEFVQPDMLAADLSPEQIRQIINDAELRLAGKVVKDAVETVGQVGGEIIRSGTEKGRLVVAGSAVIASSVALTAVGTQEAAAHTSGDKPPALVERHLVKERENLTRIAEDHGTTVSQLARDNGIQDVHRVNAGEILEINRVSEAEEQRVIVKEGDTVYDFAGGDTELIRAIVEENNLLEWRDGNVLIRPGDLLTIPPLKPSVAADAHANNKSAELLASNVHTTAVLPKGEYISNMAEALEQVTGVDKQLIQDAMIAEHGGEHFKFGQGLHVPGFSREQVDQALALLNAPPQPTGPAETVPPPTVEQSIETQTAALAQEVMNHPSITVPSTERQWLEEAAKTGKVKIDVDRDGALDEVTLSPLALRVLKITAEAGHELTVSDVTTMHERSGTMETEEGIGIDIRLAKQELYPEVFEFMHKHRKEFGIDKLIYGGKKPDGMQNLWNGEPYDGYAPETVLSYEDRILFSTFMPTPEPALVEQASLNIEVPSTDFTVEQFMAAIASQESSGNPSAENKRTRAYGLFQIMPDNWPAWSQEVLGDVVPQTPENQVLVARQKMQEYYQAFGSWEAVAVAWFAGPHAAEHYQRGDMSVLNRSDGIWTVRKYVDNMRAHIGKIDPISILPVLADVPPLIQADNGSAPVEIIPPVAPVLEEVTDVVDEVVEEVASVVPEILAPPPAPVPAPEVAPLSPLQQHNVQQLQNPQLDPALVGTFVHINAHNQFEITSTTRNNPKSHHHKGDALDVGGRTGVNGVSFGYDDYSPTVEKFIKEVVDRMPPETCLEIGVPNMHYVTTIKEYAPQCEVFVDKGSAPHLHFAVSE